MNKPYWFALAVVLASQMDPPPEWYLTREANRLPEWEVHFAPGPEPEAQVVKVYGAARKWLRVECYSFTSEPIATALIAAHHRGVDCAVIVDGRRVDEPAGQARRCAEAGIAVAADHSHPIYHNKVSIADGKVVCNGSYNYSASARRNSENLLTTRSVPLAARYATEWEAHAAHAERVTSTTRRMFAPLPQEEP